MKNYNNIKKQIIYRSTHRGTKEMDLLLGNFVKKNINNFSELELIDLDNIIKLDDEILNKWYYEKNQVNLVPNNNVSKLLKKFKP